MTFATVTGARPMVAALLAATMLSGTPAWAQQDTAAPGNPPSPHGRDAGQPRPDHRRRPAIATRIRR